jgi:Skp family chaperone for outer membrane proteins
MRLSLLPAALLAVLAFAPSTSAAPEQKVGVVDMFRLLTNHAGLKTAKNALEKKSKDAEDARNRAQEELKKTDAELRLAPKDSPQTKAKLRAFELQVITVRFEYEAAIKDAREAYVRDLEGVYANVKGLISKYALEKGYTLILQKNDDALGADEPKEVFNGIAVRGVVYHEPSLDITRDIEGMLPKPPPEGPR